MALDGLVPRSRTENAQTVSTPDDSLGTNGKLRAGSEVASDESNSAEFDHRLGLSLKELRAIEQACKRFRLSAALEADYAHWLSAYVLLLQKHDEEIARDLVGWRDYARREFNLIQPA